MRENTNFRIQTHPPYHRCSPFGPLVPDSVLQWPIYKVAGSQYLILTNTKPQNIIMSAPAPKVKKAPKAPAAHPKYSVMIAAAITALKDRTGSSRQAILKYICANYKVDAAKAAVQVRLALKRGVAKGALKMARASGKGAGSFKVVKVEKPKKVKKAKKPKAKKVKKVKKAAKKPAAKKAKKPKKAAKKPAAKKAAKKPAAKKPAAKKAAKKPAAKKAAPKKK